MDVDKQMAIESLKTIFKQGHCKGIRCYLDSCFFIHHGDCCGSKIKSKLRTRVIAVKYLTDLGVDIEEESHRIIEGSIPTKKETKHD